MSTIYVADTEDGIFSSMKEEDKMKIDMMRYVDDGRLDYVYDKEDENTKIRVEDKLTDILASY